MKWFNDEGVRNIYTKRKTMMHKYINQLSVLLLILIFCVINIISFFTIIHMQGNARVINYAGIVRGATQRLVKQEMNDLPNDELIHYLDNIISELSTGKGEYGLIVLPDNKYQSLLDELSKEWIEIKEEIESIRQGEDKQRLFHKSEDYFILANNMVSYAENYSEKRVGNAKGMLICLNLGFIILSVVFGIYEHSQKKIQQALKVSEKASQAKSEFLSSMSHEIRTPMNAIIGMTAIAQMSIDDKDKVADCLGKIDLSSNYLLTLINDILDMSRIESGKIELENKAFELNKTLECIYIMFKQKAEKENIEFCIEQDNLSVKTVMGDELRISQILINIISNALKFTPLGGKVIVEVCEKAVDAKNVTLEFTITDTGIGISKEFQSKLFKPFEQEQAMTSRKYGGTGLGLAISYNFVKMMGGELTVDSKPNEGSTFKVCLTLEYLEGEMAALEKKVDNSLLETIEQSSYNFTDVHILLAEDNPINSEIIVFFLENNGISVDAVFDGKEVVDKFENSPQNYYNIILMDIQMPVCNGLEATQKIRNLNRSDAKKVQIIGLSANAFLEDINKAKKSGIDEYLTKPVNMEKLMHMIELCLE